VPSGAPPLARDFFARPAEEVAPALLGCVLEHETADGVVAVELTEVEAYEGLRDPASHAYRGITGRNAVMYGPPGHAYVYFTYGMHFCVNVVCQPEGTASAVLLRAGHVTDGAAVATARRAPGSSARRAAGRTAPVRPVPRASVLRDLARGPGRLGQALGITRAQDGADLCAPASELRLRAPSAAVRMNDQRRISVGPRVGVTAAADTPWRFWVAGDPTVSAYRLAKKRVS
jgi:DNA-3-methyladenine glycosylase